MPETEDSILSRNVGSLQTDLQIQCNPMKVTVDSLFLQLILKSILKCEQPIIVKSESESHSMSNSLRPHGLYCSWNSPGQNTGVGSCSLPERMFPTQESNHGLLPCRWILYQLSRREPQEYWSGQPLPSPADLPNRGIEPGLLHCRWILYQLSYWGSPQSKQY